MSSLAQIPWRRIRWKLLWQAAQWLYGQGRDRLRKNLTEKERGEFFALMRKSKGRRRNLTDKERRRFVELVRKALIGADHKT
jgi:hypothetical protein